MLDELQHHPTVEVSPSASNCGNGYVVARVNPRPDCVERLVEKSVGPRALCHPKINALSEPVSEDQQLRSVTRITLRQTETDGRRARRGAPQLLARWLMMGAVIRAVKKVKGIRRFSTDAIAVNCHHTFDMLRG